MGGAASPGHSRSLAQIPLQCTLYSCHEASAVDGRGGPAGYTRSEHPRTSTREPLPPLPVLPGVSFCHSCSSGHIGGYTGRPTWPNSFQCDRFKQEDLKTLPGASTDQFWTRACRCPQISWTSCERGLLTRIEFYITAEKCRESKTST